MTFFDIFVVFLVSVFSALIVSGIYRSSAAGFIWHWAVPFFSGALIACVVAAVSFQDHLLVSTDAIDKAVKQVLQACEPNDQTPDSRSQPVSGAGLPDAGSGGETG